MAQPLLPTKISSRGTESSGIEGIHFTCTMMEPQLQHCKAPEHNRWPCHPLSPLPPQTLSTDWPAEASRDSATLGSELSSRKFYLWTAQYDLNVGMCGVFSVLELGAWSLCRRETWLLNARPQAV